MTKTPVCGDGVCGPGVTSWELFGLSVILNVDAELPSNAGEPRVAGAEETDLTCAEDCPITVGPCDSPGGEELGDATLECGGNGVCDPATRTCSCDYGYAGGACGWCDSTAHRAANGVSVLKVSAALTAFPIEEVPSEDDAPVGTTVWCSITFQRQGAAECNDRHH